MTQTKQTMLALRFHEYGEPADVLQLEDVAVPEPAENRIRIAVYACGLAPADWALCRGLFAGSLPRGVGLDVAGAVQAVGPGVSDIQVGDRVAGTTDWATCASVGAAEQAILERWNWPTGRILSRLRPYQRLLIPLTSIWSGWAWMRAKPS